MLIALINRVKYIAFESNLLPFYKDKMCADQKNQITGEIAKKVRNVQLQKLTSRNAFPRCVYNLFGHFEGLPSRK